jgi:hypothetical protein
MKYAAKDLRVPMKIDFARQDYDGDHLVETVLIQISGPGFGQGFGPFCMNSKTQARQLLLEICATFDCADPERMAGQECIALYSDSPHSDIEGLESPTTGKRFTIRGWRRVHYPDHAKTPTEARREQLKRDISHHECRLADARTELENLGELVDWETMPPWTEP